VIVNGIPETLLAAQISLRRLDGDVTQQKLNLLQFAPCLMAQSRTVRRKSCGATAGWPQIFAFTTVPLKGW
jgi:hypothetical protein